MTTMREHVAIRQERYVGGTRERPEVGVFTQTHSRHVPAPGRRIGPGERVWMKWTGGPVVASALVDSIRELPNTTPDQLRETTKGFGLYDLDEYWKQLPPRIFGLTIYLTGEAWLDDPLFPPRLSRGSSWVVLPDETTASSWNIDPPPPVSGTHPRLPGAALRFKVLRRDGFTCTYCGRRPPDVELHVDHEVPHSAGGETVIDNLRTACRDCNLGKGKEPL
jgi:hypothetical protein